MGNMGNMHYMPVCIICMPACKIKWLFQEFSLKFEAKERYQKEANWIWAKCFDQLVRVFLIKNTTNI